MITRRTALLAGASSLVLTACGTRPPRTVAGDPHDLRVLAAALEVERAQIAFYERGVQLADSPTVRTILAQERAHAAAIEETIRELGGTPPGPRASATYARGIPSNAGAWRKHAILAEEQWAAGYAALIPKLVNQRLRGTFGALMTTEAEHAAALETAR